MAETVICVGAAVLSNGRILAVRQSKGHPLEGSWTIPWGRLEIGESPAEAAIREVREESGIVASVDGLLGVQELPDPWTGWLAILYRCTHLDGVPKPDNRETDAAQYFALDELDALNESIEPWSEWFMKRVLTDDYTLTPPSDPNPFSPMIGFV